MTPSKEDILCTLLAARTLIDCEGWTQEDYARDSEGQCVDYTDPNAVCFCALGAVYVSNSNSDVRAWVNGHLQDVIPPSRYVHEWNDAHGRTKEEVLAAFDRAIAKIEAEE